MDTTRTTQQYNLKWTNHTNNILQVFTEQLTKESFVDVTLTCEGHYIKAHKMILSGCSVYFQQLFEVHTVPHPLIIMNGVHYENLKQVIDFMYYGEVRVVEENLESLLKLAETLQVKGLCSVRAKNLSEKIHETRVDNEVKKRKYSEDTKEDVQEIKSEIESDHEDIEDITEILQEPHHTIPSNEAQQIPRKMDPKRPRILKRNDAGTKSQVSVESNNSELKIYDVSKIPRPPNAFMIFANEWRKKIAEEFPTENNKEISVRLGTMWKDLSMEKKEDYYEAAQKADHDHKLKYPGYFYSPKEARKRKELKTSSKLKKQQPINPTHLVNLVVYNDASPKSSDNDVCIQNI